MKIRIVLLTALLAASVAACGVQVARHASLAAGPSTAVPTPEPPYATPNGVVPLSAANRPHPEHLTQPIALPSCPGTGHSPHFESPESAMRYLAAAWNRHDLDALCHVSNPNARFLLHQMHDEAVNLRLNHCRSNGVGDGTFSCYFDHDYPRSMHKHGTGHAVFDVGPADLPGYYMTIYEGCG